MSANSSSHDDALDFDGLDLKPAKPKAKAAESDFEKELEALFAEELASSDEKPASAPPVGAPEFEEDALLLDDLVADAPLADAPGLVDAEDDEEDILDLSAFATGGELDLAPPEETPGGKNGDIDLSGLDDLISGLGDKKPAPSFEPEPLDSTDMADLLESLDVPKAAARPAPQPAAEPDFGPEEELLELSLGDLVEEPDAAETLLSEPEASAPPSLDLADEEVLDLTLPDLSDPVPNRDLVAEQELADMGGDLNLSLPDELSLPGEAEKSAPAMGMDQILDSDDLDMTGLMEGIEPSDGEAEPELSLDPQALLDQISEPADQPAPALAAELELAESGLTAPDLAEPELTAMDLAEPELPLADAALGAVAAGVVAAAALAQPEPQPLAELLPEPTSAESAAPAQAAASSPALAELEQRLNALATQVTGGSVAVVRLEGQLAERDAALAALEERLSAAQSEAKELRDELAALRSQLEDSLDAQVAEAKSAAQAAADKAEALAARVEGAERTSTASGERLALLEDRQTQLDREIFAEISRAVPREAARVIREEIAHLAASMHDE
ncbi:hypothetical protein [Humidesulfovibrio sp.]